MKEDLKLMLLASLEMCHYLFFTGFTQVDDSKDSFNLGDDVDFLSAMNDDKEGNKSDEVDF